MKPDFKTLKDALAQNAEAAAAFSGEKLRVEVRESKAEEMITVEQSSNGSRFISVARRVFQLLRTAKD